MKFFVFWAVIAVGLQAQTLTTLANYDQTTGAPGSLILGADGNFYGPSGSALFQITPAGALTTVCTLKGIQLASIMQASDGNIYGTLVGTVQPSYGAIFKLTPGCVFTTLHTFTGPDGSGPTAPIQGTDGNLYGVTRQGGGSFSASSPGAGTVFKLTTTGTLTTLHTFSGTDGSGPNGLIQGTDGNLYGTTDYGGPGNCISTIAIFRGCGTIFTIGSGGSLSTLQNFETTDGAFPTSLIEGADGNFYGTTQGGGSGDCEEANTGPGGCGTIFKMASNGSMTTLVNFGGALGHYPASLIEANGNFYGTAQWCGAKTKFGCAGAIFQLIPPGMLSLVYSFCTQENCPDGDVPGELSQGPDGNLYGLAFDGGADGDDSTFFELSLASPDTPAIAPSGGVLNGASFQPGISLGSWMTINGTNLSSKTDTWNNSIVNGSLPTMLDGVSVTVGNQPAYIEYISPTQINALAPDVPSGTVPVAVTNTNGSSQAANAQVSAEMPAFFQWGNYVVATHQDYSYAVKNGTFAGLTTVAAKPGDVIILWGTGFGPTSPSSPAGMETPASTTYNTASAVSVTVGGEQATVYGAALASSYTGLYQVAIQIPVGLPNGDYPVIATIDGIASPSTTLITVEP
jgi:uncharacterized protein (TIGR03437 family)